MHCDFVLHSAFWVKITEALSCFTHRWVAFDHNVKYILLNIEAYAHSLFGVIVDATFYSILGEAGGGGSQLDFFGGAAMVTRLTRVIAGTRGVYCILNTNACSFPYLVESVENSLIQL